MKWPASIGRDSLGSSCTMCSGRTVILHFPSDIVLIYIYIYISMLALSLGCRLWIFMEEMYILHQCNYRKLTQQADFPGCPTLYLSFLAFSETLSLVYTPFSPPVSWSHKLLRDLHRSFHSWCFSYLLLAFPHYSPSSVLHFEICLKVTLIVRLYWQFFQELES